MATETGEPLSARRADGAAASPRSRSNCAQASGSVAGPAGSTSGGCGHVLRHEVWGDPIVLRSRRDPGRRALGSRFAGPSGLVFDGPRSSGCEGGRWRDAVRQSDRGDRVLEGIEFANGMRRYLESPQSEPSEPGPNRQGFRFARRITLLYRGRATSGGVRAQPILDRRHARVTRREAPRTTGGGRSHRRSE